MSRSDYYTLIEDIKGKKDSIAVLIHKLNEETYPGYDSISLVINSDLESLGYKNMKDFSIRFAV